MPHRSTPCLLACLLLLLPGCGDQSASQGDTSPANAHAVSAQSQTKADVPSPDALKLQFAKAVSDSLADDRARFGSNAWRDLEQLISDGVDRMAADGLNTDEIKQARASLKQLTERARRLAADSVNPNITRVELMAALSELSPLEPFVTAPFPPVVPPVPGTAIDPPPNPATP